jgi:SAM-dependent methyltransferase
VIYEQPLAYLLGLEGVALLRAFTGEFDRQFVEARLAEVRELLDEESLNGQGVLVDRVDTIDGYRVWSQTYDEPRNGLFDFEEPLVTEILDERPTGVAVDAACGTGRYAEYLAARGHQVIGVDSSPDMLARARTRVPQAEFRPGDLQDLPLADDSADIIVCGLALNHVPALAPVMAEFARVLRPGGHLVISDGHQESVALGSIPSVVGPGGRPARVSTYRHLVGDYLRAALSVGLQVRRCEEPRLPASPPRSAASPGSSRSSTPVEVGPWERWPWSLAGLVPDAAHAVNAGRPVTIVWHFRLAE